MELIVDASIIIASIVNEPEKEKIIRVTEEYDLAAPLSVHWEVGNAFSSMLKKKALTIQDVKKAIQLYDSMPIRLLDVALDASLQIAYRFNMYAYDAYIICCALRNNLALMSLDNQLLKVAKELRIKVVEV